MQPVKLAGKEFTVDSRGKTEALYCVGKGTSLGSEVVAALKKRLIENKAGAIRICLHEGPSAPVHDMIIVHRKDAPAPVHKHRAKEETYQMIEGRMRLDYFDENGRVTESIVLGEPGSGHAFITRVRADRWHTTTPETEFAVFHESRPGPFDGGDSVFPEWAKR